MNDKKLNKANELKQQIATATLELDIIRGMKLTIDSKKYGVSDVKLSLTLVYDDSRPQPVQPKGSRKSTSDSYDIPDELNISNVIPKGSMLFILAGLEASASSNLMNLVEAYENL